MDSYSPYPQIIEAEMLYGQEYVCGLPWNNVGYNVTINFSNASGYMERIDVKKLPKEDDSFHVSVFHDNIQAVLEDNNGLIYPNNITHPQQDIENKKISNSANKEKEETPERRKIIRKMLKGIHEELDREYGNAWRKK